LGKRLLTRSLVSAIIPLHLAIAFRVLLRGSCRTRARSARRTSSVASEIVPCLVRTGALKIFHSLFPLRLRADSAARVIVKICIAGLAFAPPIKALLHTFLLLKFLSQLEGLLAAEHFSFTTVKDFLSLNFREAENVGFVGLVLEATLQGIQGAVVVVFVSWRIGLGFVLIGGFVHGVRSE
jgi:hypothetical protein